jgi:hypothetical protein
VPHCEFPQMLYHIVENPIIVQNKQELDKYLEQGWSKTPKDFDEIKLVKAKIKYHQSEVERLEEILEKLFSQSGEKFICVKCGYEAKSNAGLAAHQKKHKYEQEPENETVAEMKAEG